MFGIDVHPYYQRGARFGEAYDAGVRFAWIKVSDGVSAYTKTVHGVTYRPDDMVGPAQRAGIKVGGYHYAETAPSPEIQAVTFAAELRRLRATDIPPALDIESPFVPGTVAKQFTGRFVAEMIRQGFARVAVYANTSMMASLDIPSYPAQQLIVWCATPGPAGQWANSHYSYRADVHQYTGSGSVAGIDWPTDLDTTVSNALEMSFVSAASDVWNAPLKEWDAPLEEAQAFVWLIAARREIEAVRAEVAAQAGEIAGLRGDVTNLVALLQTLVGNGVRLTSQGSITISAITE